MRVVEKELTYWRGKPVMILKPSGRDNRKRFVIKMGDLHKYSDTHNPNFMGFMTGKVMQLCALFEIQVPSRKQQFVQMMTSISDTIMDGIDEMVKMPPLMDRDDGPEIAPDNLVNMTPHIISGGIH